MTQRTRGVDALKRAVADTVREELRARLKAGAKADTLACCILHTSQGIAVTVEDRDAISRKLSELDLGYRSTEATHAIVELDRGPVPGTISTVIRTLDGQWWSGQTPIPPPDELTSAR